MKVNFKSLKLGDKLLIDNDIYMKVQLSNTYGDLYNAVNIETADMYYVEPDCEIIKINNKVIN